MLLPSFLSSNTSVTFTHLWLLFWGGFLEGGVIYAESGLCRSMCECGYDTQTVLSCHGLWDKCLLYFSFSYANLVMFPNLCLLFALCKYCLCGTFWHADFSHKAIVSGHFVILGEQGIYYYCFIVFLWPSIFVFSYFTIRYHGGKNAFSVITVQFSLYPMYH